MPNPVPVIVIDDFNTGEDDVLDKDVIVGAMAGL